MPTQSLLIPDTVTDRYNIVITTPLNVLTYLYNNWIKAFDDLHGNEMLRPQILERISTNGVELFQLNNALTTFMVSQLSGKRDDLVLNIRTRLATLPPFTYHADGTVTVGVSS
jgi:hypothetical protein